MKECISRTNTETSSYSYVMAYNAILSIKTITVACTNIRIVIEKSVLSIIFLKEAIIVIFTTSLYK
jgi:hypothetical protein